MAQKRMVSLCMAVITVAFVIACVPASASTKADVPCPESPLPLSLAAPVSQRIYFLPPYDEATSFTPAKKLYYLPVTYEIDEIRELSITSTGYEVSGQATDLYCIESITPRAP